MSSNRCFFKYKIESTENWNSYFQSNRNLLEAVPVEAGRGLTDDEKGRIADSIREFQLGEGSEGKNLSAFARAYSERNGDPLYYETIKLFIREEQRHSQILGRFMDREEIQKSKNSFVDSVFRHLRRYLGLEISIKVLLIAEMIALVYYRSLAKATASTALKAICREILKDEWMHVKFHGEYLVLIQKQSGAASRFFGSGILQRVLLSGTCLAVWANHGKVLSARHTAFTFWKAVWRIYGSFHFRVRRLSFHPFFERAAETSGLRVTRS